MNAAQLAPWLAVLALIPCTSCASTTVPGAAHLSAAQQDSAARTDDREAVAYAARFDPNAVSFREHCTPGGAGRRGDSLGECWESRINPTDSELDEARAHQRAAAEHRAASQALRTAEARACAGLSEYDRDVSPFAHRGDILRVTQLPKGALVVFRPVTTMTAASLQKIVDCHLARNDALGHQVPWMLYCPLVPRGVSATVTPQPDGLSVLIETPDADAAREVKYRVGALITPS
jgi:hypothetical protein